MEQRFRKPAGLSRRSFLKTSGAAAGAMVLGGSASVCVDKAAFADGVGQASEDKVVHCVCRPNCVGYCPLDVTVRDGNVVKTARHNFEEYPQFSRVCLRGLSNVQNIYDSERIKHPLKRAGERGEDKWEQISWDEALDTIVEKFTSIQQEYGEQAVAFWNSSGNFAVTCLTTGIGSRLPALLNATVIDPSMDFALMKGVNQVRGNGGYWVANEAATWVDAKTVIIWGANLTDAQVQEWHFLREAQEAGVKVVVIDPTFTQVAAKANRWIPIRPGSDLALYLAIMNVILEEGLQNDEFLKAHTVAPFLVRSDTGKFAHLSDTGVEPVEGPLDAMTMQPLIIDPSFVWDNAVNDFVLADEAQDPALSGTHEWQGVRCRTALDLLKDETSKFTPEVAAEYTEIPADVIRELAHICADGPVTHHTGFSQQAWTHGVATTHAGIPLCTLTGNIGYSGAGFGLSCQLSPGINVMADLAHGISKNPKISHLELRNVMRTGKLFGTDYPIRALYIYAANPLNTAVAVNEVKHDIFDAMDFIVTVDYQFTDTVRYSDLLPCAHWFEQEDVNMYGQSLFVQLSEKAIEPLYESKRDFDIFCQLGEKFGLGEHFQETPEEYTAAVLTSDYHKLMGVDYETLKEKKEMRYYPFPFVAWQDNMFFTPSGRMEFYVESPIPILPMGQTYDPADYHLPTWREPHEAWPTNPLHETYPFVLLSERSKYRVHSQWYNNAWLRELDPEPIVKINPLDAQERGIEDGAYVECFNDRGHAVAKAVYSEAIRRGTLIYPKNWQAFQHKAGCWSEMTPSYYDPINVNQSFMDNLCDIRAWEGAE